MTNRVTCPMAETILGWHFTADRQLNYGDGRRIRVGHTLVHRGPLVMCDSGLHLSIRAIDALWYAQGSLCWRVEAPRTEEVLQQDDKLCVRRRKALWVVDAERLLWRFARASALDVVHLWDAPQVVLDYLTTGDETLRAAAGAAATAARDAAGYARAAWAAWAAAWAAGDARAAAWAAAWAAATAAWAARDAAGDAARAAAGDAARDAMAAAWDDVATAAGAARAAARAAQNARLEEWLVSSHEGTLDLDAPLAVPKEASDG